MNRRRLLHRPNHDTNDTHVIQPACSVGAIFGRAGKVGAETTRKSEVEMMTATMRIAETFHNTGTLRHDGRRLGCFQPNLIANCKPLGNSSLGKHRAVVTRPSATLAMEDPSIRENLSDQTFSSVQATGVSMRTFDGEMIPALGDHTFGNGEISSMLVLSTKRLGHMDHAIKHIVGVGGQSRSGIREGASDAASMGQSITSNSIRLSKTSKSRHEVKAIHNKSRSCMPTVLNTTLASDATIRKLSTSPDELFRGTCHNSPKAASSQKPNVVAIQDSSDIALVPNSRRCPVQKIICAYPSQLVSSTYCAPSLLSTIELSTSPSLRVETDDDSIVSFVPKPETPAHITRIEIFGEDPPTPSTYCPEMEHRFSFMGFDQPSQSKNDLQESYLESPAGTDCREQLQSDVADFHQPNAPDIVSHGIAIISAASNVYLDDSRRETVDCARPVAALLQRFDEPQIEDRPALLSTQKECPRSPFTIQQFDIPSRDHQKMHMKMLEKYRSQETEKIKEQLLLRAAAKSRSREEAARRVDETRSWRKVADRGVLRPFKKIGKEHETARNMAFTTLHVVEYGGNCRRLVETRVEPQHRIYVDHEEFICPVRRGRSGWIIVDPADRQKTRNRFPWFRQTVIKRKQKGPSHLGCIPK